jgi:Zn finger protein HypA/HybF involved in hydrogenase expression
MALTLEQKDRIRDWLYESDIAFLVDWIMDNTYDSRLEDLAQHIGAQEVHCLKCDNTWTEGEFLSVCPHCGNTDTEQTVYLIKEQA